MGKLFSQNIDWRGRVLRMVWGLLLIGGGVLLFHKTVWGGFVLFAGGVFALFEAARGWCVMRACGIKTKY